MVSYGIFVLYWHCFLVWLAASRMVSAYIGNDPEARPMKEPGSLSLEPVLSTTPVSGTCYSFSTITIQ
jgi:hypothetical protein